MGHIRSFPSPMMRAPGNLSYLQLVEAIKNMWASAAPDVPLVTAGPELPTSYPSVVCHLEMRTDSEDVGKPTFQEYIEDELGNQFQTSRIAFRNVINFDVYHDGDADVADLTMERFELFFIESIPLLERLGAKDVKYGRRNADNEGARKDEGVTTRSLSVMATTEHIIVTPVTRLDSIMIEATVDYNPHSRVIEPHHGIEDTTANYQPRYYTYGASNPVFQVAEDELEFLYIPMTNFKANDVIYLAPLYGYEFIDQHAPFYVQIQSMDNDPYLLETRYRVLPYDINTGQTYGDDDSDDLWSFQEPGKGQVFYVTSQVVETEIN